MGLISVRRPLYLHGANLAWLNYGGDFGGGAVNGNISNQPVLDHWFRIIHEAGMNTIRWFMFTDDPWQIRRNSAGLPTSIDPGVWADLDVALALAEMYNVYLNLVIFDHPETLPAQWRDTAIGRQRLMTTLSAMFKRYQNHPRILAWELFNEADNRIIPPNYRVDPVGLKAMIRAFTDKVHSTTSTLATTSNGGATTLSYFVGLGLDFYSAHWYDNGATVRTDGYNVALHDYAYYADGYGIDAPLLIGEFYADSLQRTRVSVDEKYAYFVKAGYAGALGWSATPSANDGLRIDWLAARRFSVPLT